MKHNVDFAIVIPIRNPSTILWRMLQSIDEQACQPKEVVLVIDGGVDTAGLERRLRKRIGSDSRWQVLVNHKTLGLANAYNLGLASSKSPIVVFVHQDVLPQSQDSLCDLLEPFFDESIVAVGHQNLKWQREHVQKATIPLLGFLSATQYKEASGWDGKFDGVRRSALEQIGNFDSRSFRSAGEDGDVVKRLNKVGIVKNSSAGIYHLQTDENFTWRDYLAKRFQYAEALGALVRRRATPVSSVLISMWREWSFLAFGIGCMIARFWDLVGQILIVVGFAGWLPLPLIVARDSRRPAAFVALVAIEPLASAVGILGLVRGFLNGAAQYTNTSR